MSFLIQSRRRVSLLGSVHGTHHSRSRGWRTIATIIVVIKRAPKSGPIKALAFVKTNRIHSPFPDIAALWGSSRSTNATMGSLRQSTPENRSNALPTGTRIRLVRTQLRVRIGSESGALQPAPAHRRRIGNPGVENGVAGGSRCHSTCRKPKHVDYGAG